MSMSPVRVHLADCQWTGNIFPNATVLIHIICERAIGVGLQFLTSSGVSGSILHGVPQDNKFSLGVLVVICSRGTIVNFPSQPDTAVLHQLNSRVFPGVYIQRRTTCEPARAVTRHFCPSEGSGDGLEARTAASSIANALEKKALVV